MVGLQIVLPEAARATRTRSAAAGGPVVVEGAAVGGVWGVDGGPLLGRDGMFGLYRGPELPGDAYLAVGGTADRERWLWTVNDELVLTDDTGAELRRATLGWGAAYVPASEAAPGLTGSDWLIAGRSVSTSTGVGMRVERRSLEGLSVVSEHPLSSYEAAVDRPEPRAMEVGPGVAVLAWVSQRRTSDDSASLCVYLTPLDEDGASSACGARTRDP